MDNIENLLAIDVETSGSDPFMNQILSLAIVPFGNHPPIQIFIKHDKISWTKIAQDYFENNVEEWSEKAVNVDRAYEMLDEYLNKLPLQNYFLVGHNVGFDISFLKQLLTLSKKNYPAKLSHRSIDTFSLAHIANQTHKIEKRIQNSDDLFDFFDVLPNSTKRHTAIADAEAVKKVYIKLLDIFRLPSK